MPGVPVTLYESWPVNLQQRARLIAEYGFDQPLPTQYGIWLQRTVTGQWGYSRYYNRPVLRDIWYATRLTLMLLLWTSVVWSAWRALLWGVRHVFPRARLPRRVGKLLPVIEALPNFVVAIVLRDLTIWQLGWISMANVPLFDPYYLINPLYMFFPALALALTPLYLWHISSRCSTGPDIPPESEAIPQGATGVPRRRVWRQHLARFCTLLRPLLGGFLMQIFLTEYVFAFPGLGSFGIEALKRRDFPTLQGFVLCTGVLYFVLRLGCDWGARASGQEPLAFAETPTSPAPPTATPRAIYRSCWCLLVLLALAAWAPRLLPYDPMEIHSQDQFQLPGYRYILGTDFLGRDVLSRTMKGFRSSIPRIVVLTVLTGAVGWLCLGLTHGLPRLLKPLWSSVQALLQGIPSFLLAFVAFLVVEHRPWALDIALLTACLPMVTRLLAVRATVLHRLAQVVQLGGYLLVLEVAFHFLNLSTESFTPSWGSDIRHSMHYGHVNRWMLFAPAVAVVWSRYTFHQLSRSLPSTAPAPSRRRYEGVIRRRGRSSKKSPTRHITTLITWGMRRGPR
jgi:peptide/nickel transport system permease protein